MHSRYSASFGVSQILAPKSTQAASGRLTKTRSTPAQGEENVDNSGGDPYLPVSQTAAQARHVLFGKGVAHQPGSAAHPFNRVTAGKRQRSRTIGSSVLASQGPFKPSPLSPTCFLSMGTPSRTSSSVWSRGRTRTTTSNIAGRERTLLRLENDSFYSPEPEASLTPHHRRVGSDPLTFTASERIRDRIEKADGDDSESSDEGSALMRVHSLGVGTFHRPRNMRVLVSERCQGNLSNTDALYKARRALHQSPICCNGIFLSLSQVFYMCSANVTAPSAHCSRELFALCYDHEQDSC